jgi:hypothetical protein
LRSTDDASAVHRAAILAAIAENVFLYLSPSPSLFLSMEPTEAPQKSLGFLHHHRRPKPSEEKTGEST